MPSFLDSHPDFTRASAEWRLRAPADPRFLQILPHRDGTDGFFIARLERGS